MNKHPKISIIIPLYIICDRFFKDLKKFNNQSYPNYEVLVVSDKKVQINNLKTKLILTKSSKTGPAEKRDIALKYAKGEICAFIDDDAYPDPNWLNEIVNSFNNPNISGVGGPGITPLEDSYSSRLGGAVYESIFTSGKAQDRFVSKKMRTYVDDWPAFNLAIKTQDLRNVGGYGNSFYGGEDTFLCLKLIQANKRLIYNPKMIVNHHRRPLFYPHLCQIFNVGVHRGYFAKAFPQTSFRAIYFLPSTLTVSFLIFLTLATAIPSFRISFTIVSLLIFLLAFFSINKRNGVFGRILAGTGVILTHITYGSGFIKGLFTKNLNK